MPATDTFWRNLKTLHVVFAVSAAAMFGTTIWMMAEDHADEWRGYQRTFDDVQAERFRRERQAIETDPAYEERVQELQDRLAAARQELREKEDELRELRQEVERTELAFDLTNRAIRTQRAIRDKLRADYDLAVRDGRSPEVLNRRKQRFAEQQARVDELEIELQNRRMALDDAQARLRAETEERDELEAELTRERTEIDRLHAALRRIEPEDWLSWAKRKMMQMPVIDGFNSPRQIHQDWLPDLHITLGMTHTARFDRCRTCHVSIDATEGGGEAAFPHGTVDSDRVEDWIEAHQYPHPFATHPRPELFMTAASPHPVERFGCTICHEGQGSGTSFSNAEHGPNDPHQRHLWEDEYNFEEDHYWEFPMYPKRLQEASCIKCHHSVVELGVNREFGASAPKVFKGFELVEKLGCFGCHEIHGDDAGRPIGPDLRLEPNYTEAALQLLSDERLRSPAAEPAEEAEQAEDAETQQFLAEIHDLARRVADRPDDTARERRQLRSLILDDRESEEPELSLHSHRLAAVLQDHERPGKYRKPGPALRHIAEKTTAAWIEYWTEEPQRFRPTTTMPQFFKLSNQQDPHAQEFMPVELAGIAQYLMDHSQPLDLLRPEEGYEPDPERGRELFSQRGCLACHTHEAFPGIDEDFAPSLDEVHAKLKPGEDGFNWLYTWIREPERYHPRTKMPNLFLEPEGRGENRIDPAADIAAFLLEEGPEEYEPLEVGEEKLDELVRLYLSAVLTNPQVEETLATRRYPFGPEQIRGDEIELSRDAVEEELTEEEWQQAKLRYVGRRTISRYGCYGCHDVPGFEAARPIGTVLQDWGRKDTERLAFEHVAEYLHHHGEPEGFPGEPSPSSTRRRVDSALRRVEAGDFKTEEDEEREMSAAYFYDNLLHYGRPGFIWQKLREPRSYDYEKTETMGYDERLMMPKFPVDEEEIEAIATFVLGLVADPPGEQYLYRPPEPVHAEIEGERLLTKYNCTACHMIDLPRITYGADPDLLPMFDTLDADDHVGAFDLLMRLKPPRDAETGATLDTGEPVISFHGLPIQGPDPEEEPEYQEYFFELWENVNVDGRLVRPSATLSVPVPNIQEIEPARGGEFAEWLVTSMVGERPDPARRNLAWQAAPPPLYLQGPKVQTPWLYQFLRHPERLRHTTVLRMPQFNMSDAEARALANYFAAYDGEPYPYQEIPQRQPGYLAAMERQAAAHAETDEAAPYLDQAWDLLNNPGLCINCHSVGGREVQVADPATDIRGPDLKHTHDRLRPEWLMLWMYNPRWITPYTSMPAMFPRTNPPHRELLGGDGNLQAIGVRDALLNYHRLMEIHGQTAAPPPPEDDDEAAPDADAPPPVEPVEAGAQ